MPSAPTFLFPTLTRLSTLAERPGLSVLGEDRQIAAFGSLSTRSRPVGQLLTYVTTPEYLQVYLQSDIAACVLHESLASGLPAGRSALITAMDPAECFYSIFTESVNAGGWTSLKSYRGHGTHIAPSASIASDAVVIGDNCTIMQNVVIFPQTYIADDVVIEPNSTIGGTGFQLAMIDGRRRVVPHAGGVCLGNRVTVGSQTCIDRGLFGEFTRIGDDSHIDNLVHIAHSVSVGEDAAIVACAEVSGSVVIGDGVWLAPSCAINPGLKVGDHALVGTGSTVVSDIPPHVIAYGAPARVRGERCECGKSFPTGASNRCDDCGWET
jgi:UDP-3-O-[3-hydroxymyristoyl] glucosamine N-acyltransferase